MIVVRYSSLLKPLFVYITYDLAAHENLDTLHIPSVLILVLLAIANHYY